VFQRTAAYCVPAHNGPIDAALQAQIKGDYPGFRERNRAMYGGFGSLLPPGRQSALAVSAREREAAYEQRWQVGGFAILAAFPDTMRDLRANALAAEFVRQKIRATVKDAATAERLCPQQPIGCKRLCVDTGYYETFNLPQVRLVDVKAQPIEGFTPNGLQVQGEHHALDAVILATGFDAISGAFTRLDIQGCAGLTLKTAWREGAQAHLGLMVAGFPNFFTITGPGSSAAFTNVMVAIEHHVNWIAQCVAALLASGKQCIEPTQAAQAAWMDRLQGFAQESVFLHCDSWYLGANIPGKPRRFLAMAGGFPTYAKACDEAARQGYEGFVLT
jgi:cation diffusion facilitator CzcD-associated flavoprotein CzcO